ncbi:hypothetical protein CO661_31795 [Sinorhizobium fredii]|uniref:Uncharacterized protein n=2 Tax=Rhizobium fredii TaxID=380 RepID=I3XGR1_SINF2|nr:hypothetical protein USDA257_p03520 [Sinorhizobium fredii USDA 257]PDT43987.1 hypothetical protein CO661_31795 [Sinorhizobium fredii]CEO91454.1 hypothetical protein SFHH103_psfHH103d_256 [Sinorhizobium fredii HH103]
MRATNTPPFADRGREYSSSAGAERNGLEITDAIFEGMGEPGMKWIEVTGRGQRRYRTDEDE